MVQIIPRTRPTFGEQVAGGMQRGAQKASQYGQLLAEQHLAEQSKAAEFSRKMNLAKEYRQKLIDQGVDEKIADIAAMDMGGVISAQSGKSLINLFREQQDRDFFGNLGLGGQPQAEPSQETPMGGQINAFADIGEPQEAPSTKKAPKTQYAPGFTDDQLAALAGAPGQKGAWAQNMLDLRKEERTTAEIPKKEFFKHAAQQNADFIAEIGNVERNLPNTTFALAGIEDALGDAGKWAAVRDVIAERTGFEGARSAAGAELDSFIKNYFLGDLSSIRGGRPNVFIEKQIRDAYQKAGRDPISNQKVLIGMKMKEDIDRTYVDEARKLEKHYLDKDGFLPPSFKSKVIDKIKDKVGEIEKKSVDTLHYMSKIEEQRDKLFRGYLKKGEVLMMDESGQPFAVPKKEVSMYRERGFIPLGEK